MTNSRAGVVDHSNAATVGNRVYGRENSRGREGNCKVAHRATLERRFARVGLVQRVAEPHGLRPKISAAPKDLSGARSDERPAARARSGGRRARPLEG